MRINISFKTRKFQMKIISSTSLHIFPYTTAFSMKWRDGSGVINAVTRLLFYSTFSFPFYFVFFFSLLSVSFSLFSALYIFLYAILLSLPHARFVVVIVYSKHFAYTRPSIIFRVVILLPFRPLMHYVCKRSSF